jgi:hypothetical protein
MEPRVTVTVAFERNQTLSVPLWLCWIGLSPVLSLRPNGLPFGSGRPQPFFFMIFKIFFNVTNFLGNRFYRYRDEGNARGGPLP